MVAYKNIEEIVLAKASGQELSRDELVQFDRWYADGQNRLNYESLLRIRSGVIATRADSTDTRKAWAKVAPPCIRTRAAARALRYAAMLAIPLIAAGYLVWRNISGECVAEPGNTTAIFTLPSGERFVLSETEKTRIKNGGGVINIEGLESVDSEVGSAGRTAAKGENAIATLEIPRGGYICYVLSDGSKVWLNSESRLRFPITFAEGPRGVELEGEAYFQVAADGGRPFTVRTGDYDIHVTGTEFNVRSYGRGTTATTLVEGGVEIELDGMVSILSPGRQAVIGEGGILTCDVDVDRYVAWRHGAFSYSQTPLGEIMDDLARWYDIEVVWENPEVRGYHFSAWFDRKSEIGGIIEILGKTNRVDLSLKGRTLTIREKNI